MSVRILALAASALAACACSAQQPAPLVTNTEHRTNISLNGPWRAIVDPYDTGLKDYRSHVRSKDGFFQNAKPQTSQDLIEYNFDKSETLNVPGDWNTQRPTLLFYEGTVWYEKSFPFHPKPHARVFLHLGAANYFSIVGVNGTVVCDHEGGFTSFDCEVTPLLHEGENFVVIYVNNMRRAEGVPTLSTDWWNYGGLTRDVQLVEVPEHFIQDSFIHLVPGSKEQVAGWVKLSDTEADQKVTLKIPELSIEKSVTTDRTGVAEFSFSDKRLQLWSPGHPKLYKVEIETSAGGSGTDASKDKIEDEIGLRSIEVRGHDILLNGAPIFLRGVSIHEEAPYRSGRAYTDEDAKTLLGWVQELGANFVRLAHYPHNEHMLRMADRMGLMVWSEIPVYWDIKWDNPATLANAQNQLTENITRDKNRASIVIWSVGNETPVTGARTKFMQSLVKTARSLDSTRLLSAALQVQHKNGTTRVIDDPLGADLDVLGCNEYIGWYEGKPEDADKANWKSPYDKPLVMSEFGGSARAGLHGNSEARFTEEYQEDLYKHQTAMLDRIPFLGGTSPWILMEFRSPRRLLPGIQDYYNRKGLVSDQGKKKKAFYVLKKWYEMKEMAEHPVH
jgi:beta-glucuronidase